MSSLSPYASPARRSVLATAAAVGAVGLTSAALASIFGAAHAATLAENTAIRPFKVHIPNEALADLRRRIAATRWPPRDGR